MPGRTRAARARAAIAAVACLVTVCGCALTAPSAGPELLPAPTSADAAALATLTREDARHLLARTGFGVSESDLDALQGLPRRQAVEILLAGLRSEPAVPAPLSLARYVPLPSSGIDAAVDDLRAWWFAEMLQTPSPLTERLVLFWHGYFATRLSRVPSPTLLFRQNLLLRRGGVTNFAQLLYAMTRDPALLLQLDASRNVAHAPDETLARAVLAHYTVGEGHFDDRDVVDVARAFTGWGVDLDHGDFVRRDALHDDGPKTVLGRTGRLTGDDVVEILLGRPETAESVARRFWLEFVSADPDPAEVSRAAAAFRLSGYEVRTLLRALLLGDAFWAPSSRGVLVRSPVELVVGTLRTFGARVPDTGVLAPVAAALGQDLLDPPGISGWPGGMSWLEPPRRQARRRFLDRVLGDAGAEAGADDGGPWRALSAIGFDATAWLAPYGGQDGRARLAALLLPVAPEAATTPDVAAPAFLRALLRDPAHDRR